MTLKQFYIEPAPPAGFASHPTLGDNEDARVRLLVVTVHPSTFMFNPSRPVQFILAALGALAVALAGAAAPLKAPTYLDAAPLATTRAGGAVLTPADLYDAARGYGWATAPADSFAHPAFGGVRSPALIDGVAGSDFALRLDLEPGRWTALVFLDDGYENAHTDIIELNGRAVAHNPRVFGLDSEPPQPPISRYRVAQFVITANGPTELRFRQAGPGGARLLAIHLLPMDWKETDITRWLRRQVEDAGRHDFSASLDILRADLERHGRDPALTAASAYWKAQLDLLAEAQHWHQAAGWDEVSSRTHSSMFTRYKIAVAVLDPLVDHPDGDAFPLRDRARWLRARLLYWLWAEQHNAGDQTALEADLAVLRKKYPNDQLIAMYAGEKIADTGRQIGFAPHPAAPAWSVAEYEALQRLRDVAYYWIDQRQIPNGEFGGKTDDDVELLRWWPVLMLSGDSKVSAGFGKLAEGMWFSPKINLGYAREPRDVEHSAEYVSDTLPMMALITRDPVWIDRLGWSFRHMRDLWTGRNEKGDLLFKSAWFSSTEILSQPPRNRDLSMNARAAKTVRYHAWLKADAAATQLLHDWSLSWAKAAAGTEKGKPKGLFPASLRWPDGAVNGDEPTWHHANMMWDYFNWEGDGRLYDQLLFSWLGTRDDRLLQPMRDTLSFIEKTAPKGVNASAAEGSPEWAATTLLESEEFWNVVAQWRLETGDTSHDTFLSKHGPAYLRYRLTGDVAALGEKIESSLLETLRYNRPMRTSEVLFTDRVYVSPNGRGEGGTDLLSAMLTGGHSAQGQSPFYHVAWERTPTTFTALVTSTGSDHVAADIFLHQKEKAEVVARVLRLAPGKYHLTVKAGSKSLIDRAETITGPDHRVTLELPGAETVSITIRRVASP